jgi:hypothetical protein
MLVVAIADEVDMFANMF